MTGGPGWLPRAWANSDTSYGGRIARSGDKVCVEILEPFRPAMQLLDHSTHLIVVWLADKHDHEKSRAALQCEPPYAPGRVRGVFATRAEYRPNPIAIAITTCKTLCIDEQEGIIQIADIDAVDGTPAVNFRSYYPVCDRIREARIPEWLSDGPEWMPDEGLGLQLFGRRHAARDTFILSKRPCRSSDGGRACSPGPLENK